MFFPEKMSPTNQRNSYRKFRKTPSLAPVLVLATLLFDFKVTKTKILASIQKCKVNLLTK